MIYYTRLMYTKFQQKNQLVDNWAADEISVSEILFRKYLEYVLLILGNYKKLKNTRKFRFTISSIYQCAINISDNFNMICWKTKMCCLNITFLQGCT